MGHGDIKQGGLRDKMSDEQLSNVTAFLKCLTIFACVAILSVSGCTCFDKWAGVQAEREKTHREKILNETGDSLRIQSLEKRIIELEARGE